MSDDLPPSKFGAGYTVGGDVPQPASPHVPSPQPPQTLQTTPPFGAAPPPPASAPTSYPTMGYGAPTGYGGAPISQGGRVAKPKRLSTRLIVLSIVVFTIIGAYVARAVAVGKIEDTLREWAAGTSSVEEVLCKGNVDRAKPQYYSDNLLRKWANPEGGISVFPALDFTTAYATMAGLDGENSEFLGTFELKKEGGRWKVCSEGLIVEGQRQESEVKTFLGWAWGAIRLRT